MGLFVTRNHDYTISIYDGKGKELIFRDITGKDLEFFDKLFDYKQGEDERKQTRLDFVGIEKILSLLILSEVEIGSLTRRVITEVFKHVNENILCNYMPKYHWLQACYGIQNGSFSNLAAMEEVPMTKFIAMVQIHKDAMDSIRKE